MQFMDGFELFEQLSGFIAEDAHQFSSISFLVNNLKVYTAFYLCWIIWHGSFAWNEICSANV